MKLLQIFQEFILNFNIIFISNIGPKVTKDQARESFNPLRLHSEIVVWSDDTFDNNF